MMEENRKPDSYGGRRIVTVMVNGKPVETVEGLYSWSRVPTKPAIAEAAGVRTRTRRPYFGLSQGVPSAGASDLGELIANPLAIHHGAATTPNDVEFHRQWGLHQIRADEAWERWQGDAQRVVVAVLCNGSRSFPP